MQNVASHISQMCGLVKKQNEETGLKHAQTAFHHAKPIVPTSDKFYVPLKHVDTIPTYENEQNVVN